MIIRGHYLRVQQCYMYYIGNDYLGSFKCWDGVWKMDVRLKQFVYRGIVTK
jgi:hypothetical protein